MNVLEGKIIKIQTKGNLSIVSVDVNGVILKSIIIETPESVPYLSIGRKIKLYFKETEVVLAKKVHTDISLRNKIECTVADFENGELLSRVVLNYKGNTISSVITSEAFSELSIVKEASVIAMIKTNEIMFSDD